LTSLDFCTLGHDPVFPYIPNGYRSANVGVRFNNHHQETEPL